ncbi:hypothetical protein [Comamonas sp. GB3 AK4-5]|uniref:hypothetical protein n=1 Tax=Comamonas sp. GB3 AK4-5 TaxID=3231487 RepID=UPI00351DF72E
MSTPMPDWAELVILSNKDVADSNHALAAAIQAQAQSIDRLVSVVAASMVDDDDGDGSPPATYLSGKPIAPQFLGAR